MRALSSGTRGTCYAHAKALLIYKLIMQWYWRALLCTCQSLVNLQTLVGVHLDQSQWEFHGGFHDFFFLKAPRSTRESCKISRRGCPSSLGTRHTEDAHHYTHTHTQHTRTQSPGTQVRTGARTPAGTLPSAGVTAGPEAHPRIYWYLGLNY